MSKELANFLGQFRLIKEKHDAVAAANGERFNIFSVLGMESEEMKTHSALITDLLNPNGTHSQGAVFVRLFFTMLRDEFPNRFKWELTDDEINGFEVTAEAHRDDCGRIDILMESPGKCIIIENKIYAGDQERQLGRYYEYAMGKFAKENIVVIYLTRWGNEPNDYTLGKNLDKEKVLCVSYSQHIIKWLENCLKETARIAHIRETLFQYQSLLRKLTGQTLHRKFIMDTNQIFSKSKHYELIPKLEEAIPEFKLFVQRRFWDKLKRKIEGFPEVKKAHYFSAKEAGKISLCEKEDFEEEIKRCCKRYKSYGLAFLIEKINVNCELFLFIQLDGKYPIWYSFSIIKNDKIIKVTPKKETEMSNYKDKMEKIDGWVKSKDDDYTGRELDLFGYKPSAVQGACCPDVLDEEYMEYMANNKKMKKIVDEMFPEIKELAGVFWNRGR